MLSIVAFSKEMSLFDRKFSEEMSLFDRLKLATIADGGWSEVIAKSKFACCKVKCYKLIIALPERVLLLISLQIQDYLSSIAESSRYRFRFHLLLHWGC